MIALPRMIATADYLKGKSKQESREAMLVIVRDRLLLNFYRTQGFSSFVRMPYDDLNEEQTFKHLGISDPLEYVVCKNVNNDDQLRIPFFKGDRLQDFIKSQEDMGLTVKDARNEYLAILIEVFNKAEQIVERHGIKR